MKTIKQIILLSSALLMLLATGCDKTYDEPAPFVPAQMNANTTIKEFKALYTGTPTVITDTGIVISGRVISTDKFGNFYRSFFIQDGSSGIEVKVGRTTLYNTYKIGQIVYVKPATLCLGKYGSMVNLGFSSADPKYETAYIDAAMIIEQTIFKGAMGATPLDTVAIKTSADITEDNMGKLVTLKGATYKSGSYRLNNVTYSPLYTWAVKDDPNTTVDDSAYGEQIFTLSGGGDVTVRTSGYAKFASNRLPDFVLNKLPVNITGVLTKFNTTIQLVLNTDSDVKPAQ